MRQVAVDSVVGSVWTLVSRASGLVRVVVVAAVLGPTQFGNLYQATNLIPNLTFELLTGALFASLVVPALVRHLDGRDTAAATRLASGFLSVAVLAAAVVLAVVVAAGPLVVALLTSGVPDSAVQTPTGLAWVLLALLVLQVPLYLVIGMAAAVQNARGRYALAAAAPGVENVGIVLALAAYALVRDGVSGGPTLGEVVVLGAGTTAAVALHALVQWFGARRAGVTLRPARSRGDAEVRALVRLAVPSLGYSSLSVARYFVILVVAAAVPGGVVAFTLALAFYNLPVALGARPVAQAALPGLSRAHQRGDDRDYSETFDRSLALALSLTVPAAAGYLLLSEPLAAAVSFGQMATPEGRELVRYCLLGIGLGLVGEAAVVFGTQASYARRDAARPLRAVGLRTVLAVAGMLGSLTLLDGAALLLGVGLSLAVSDLVAGALLCWSVRRGLPGSPAALHRTLLKTLGSSAAMVPAVLGVLAVLGPPVGQLHGVGIVLVAGATGAVTYLGTQLLLGSAEVTALVGLLGRRVGRRSDGWVDAVPSGGATKGAAAPSSSSSASEGRSRSAYGRGILGPVLCLLAVGLALAPAVASAPRVGLVLCAGLLLVLLTALWPVPAVVAYVAATPLLVGLGRGALVPGLRLNEVLLLPVITGVGLVVLRRWWAAGWQLPRGFHPMDVAVVAVAGTSSVTTLLWMYARDRPIAVDDVLYAIVLWKLAALYAAIRLVLRDVRSVRRALAAVVLTSGVIGGLGVLQAVGVGPVIDLLTTFIPPEEGGYELTINRATSTLGHPIAYRDHKNYTAVALAALALRFPHRATALWTVAGMLAVSALASGQISVVLGLLAAGVAFATVSGTARKAAPAALGLLAVAFVLLQPVISARVSALDPQTRLPLSWTGRYGRIDNLRRYFWPDIGTDFNWLFGVRTSSRVAGDEFWREWVYIESGYTWMLWNGGLPLLVSVLALLFVAFRTGRSLMSSQEPLAGAIGTTLATVPWALAMLLFLDPHMTLRGAADLLFVLLALGATLHTQARSCACGGAAVARRRVAHSS